MTGAVTIRLDRDTVAYFKAMAAKGGEVSLTAEISVVSPEQVHEILLYHLEVMVFS